MKEIPELREKQVEQLAHYIRNLKTLDLSDPGTGKTPPVCVYAYFIWNRWENKTLWTMPKSLLKKNKAEMERFTRFEDEDVVILRTDRADLTQNWTGPTIESFRTRRGFRVKLQGRDTTTIELRDLADEPLNFRYKAHKPNDVGPDWEWKYLGKAKKDAKNLEIEIVLTAADEPEKVSIREPERFKDLIEAAKHAKVFICTFAFASEHWERILTANPDVDLLLADEFHMPGGYSSVTSKATESFFYINQHVSRFVGMTGTLINGRLDTAFPAIHVIEPRYYGSFGGFMFEHAAATDEYGTVKVWKNHDRLQAILNKHSIKRTFEEVYGKEPVVFFTEYVDMHENVQKHYTKFEQEALLELDDGRIIDGSLPGVASMRARQIMAHPETMFSDVPEWTDKDERVRIHLSEGKKTLVYASLQPEQERIVRLAKSMGLRVGLINANVSGPQRAKVDEAAQRGELDVIVASGPTAAVGFNWEMFDVVLFASINFQDSDVLQAYRRASRGTRTSVLKVYFIRYRSRVETRMYDIVEKKSREANLVDPTRRFLAFSEM